MFAKQCGSLHTMRFLLVAAASLLFGSSNAIFADEAWSIDYHYALLGEPQQDTTFFHQPNPNSRASLLYTLSDRGALGAVNPRDGSIVWRHLLSQDGKNTSSGFLRAAEGQDVVISGFGDEIAAWSAGDGRLGWSTNTKGLIEDVEILELKDSLAAAGSKDIITITSGDSASVQRLDGTSGATRWQHKLDGSDVPFQVSASSTEIFAIMLHKTMLGYYKIRVISIDSITGNKKDEYTLSSESELASPDTILSVGANSASPIIAWTDATFSTLKINIIGTKGISSFAIEKHGDKPVEKVQIQAPYHTNSLAHFLVHYETADSHWADVLHINLSKNKINKAYSLPNIAGKGAFATSVSDANVYFTRMTQDELMTVSSASHGVLGKWPVQGLGAAVGTAEIVTAVHATSELSIKADAVSAVRNAVLLSTGDWVLLRDGAAQWMRPEALADIRSATFVLPSAAEEFAQELEIEAHGNPVAAYVHRVKRHIHDLQLLPSLLASLPQRMISGFLGTSLDGGISRDTFGFHQIIACATGNGRLVALDAGNPDRVMWSRKINDMKTGSDWNPRLSAQGDALVLEQDESSVQLAFNATNGQVLPAVPKSEVVVAGPNVQYTIHDGGLEAKRLDTSNAGTVWNFVATENEKILSLVPRPVNDPVASIGKVLGDRRVLYKYLDPNLALLVTTNDAAKSANFYVLDTVSGSILFSNAHTNIDLSFPVASVMSENWFAYSYTGEASESSPKGHQLVVGEMFESLVPNDRGSLQSQSNFSTLQSTTNPFTLAQTYQIPESVSKLSVTRTKQGITSRQLLAVIPASNAIVGIPYQVLDPRRPVGRDPTKDEQAEGLVRYSPVVEFDPKWYLNHQREVLGVDNIITSPALIESTSLVFAYGLDVFGTRLAPSFSFDVLGRSFNKFQMLATVAALFVATIVVAPLVTRKRVDTRWMFT
jgi:ER membrane protein complex subunit 1